MSMEFEGFDELKESLENIGEKAKEMDGEEISYNKLFDDNFIQQCFYFIFCHAFHCIS